MILAQVLLRAYDRATAIQQAMTSRGAMNTVAAGSTRPDDSTERSGTVSVGGNDVLRPQFSNASAPVLQASRLTFSYIREGRAEIDNVSLSVNRGEIVFLCGSNGSGKSTLLKLFAGILRPAEGEVHLAGNRLDKTLRNQAFRYVGLLFQDPNDQVFCTTVREDVAFGPRNMGLPPEDVERLVVTAMELTEILHLADRPIHRLSYGEMKRIALAGLIAMRSPLLLLDEPRAFLDPASAEHFVALVKKLNEELDYTFVIVTHDMDFAAQAATRVVILDRGGVAADGTPRLILTDQELLEQSRLEPPILTRVFGSLGASAPAREDIPLTAEEATRLLTTRDRGTT